jgi:hypothetical protein
VRKIHIIDLAVRNGGQWTILMQVVANRYEYSLELLKITVVGTSSKHVIEHPGKQLASFAQAANLPFFFQGSYGIRHA